MPRSRSSLRIVIFLAAASAVVAALVWLVRGDGAPSPEVVIERGGPPPPGEEARVIAPDEAASARAPSVELPIARATESAKSEPRPSTPAPTVTLVGVFVRPDNKTLELPHATVELASASAARLRTVVERATSVRVEGLAPGLWTVDVESPGLSHRRQSFDLSPMDGGADAEERLILWPERWVAVIARTSDGRPFSALAEELGIEAKRLFVGAFELRVRNTPPEEHAWESTAKSGSLATFHLPPTYQAWELPGEGVIGSLELHVDPPLWVGLALHGLPLEWQRLEPDARELVFLLGLAELERSFAHVSLRVVDAESGAPVAGAKVTVRADTSAHRRQDLQEVETGADGRVEIARVIPGGHELVVTDGTALAQDHLVLAAGERLDLGDVVLARGAPILVRVVDSNGAPARTYVDVGRFVEGERISVLFPQMGRYHSKEDGRFEMPHPSAPAIVRAATEMGRSNGRIRGGKSTANHLVDPRAPSGTPIVLVLQDHLEVRFETHDAELATIEIADEIGVVIDWAKADGKGEARFELIPGRYRARFLDAGGKRLGETPFEVREAGSRVTWP